MDDKKKTIAVGSLFVVLAAVGVFQFSKMGGEEQSAPANPPADAKAGDGKAVGAGKSKPEDAKADKGSKAETVKNPLLVADLGARDPFVPGDAAKEAASALDPQKPAPTPSPAPVAQKAPAPSKRVPELPRLGLEAPVQPVPLTGTLLVAHPDAPVQPKPEKTFSWRLKGIMWGDRPIAVFEDADGKEKIVTVGESIDGEAKLVSIRPKGANVRFNGRSLFLTPGGNEK